MDLGNGLHTPGFAWEETSGDNIRKVRKRVELNGKTVLDLGSWDGMWAFEAEALGAQLVVATDCMNYWQIPWQQGMNNILIVVREALFSEVIPFWNISVNKIRERLNASFSTPIRC